MNKQACEKLLEKLRSKRHEKEMLKNILHGIQAQNEDTKLLNRKGFNHLEYILSNIDANLYCKDKSGVYILCNKNLLDIFHLKSRDELYGKTDRDLMSSALAKRVIATDERVMRVDKDVTAQEEGFDLFGNKAIYFTRKVALQNELGEVIGLLGISIDITERIDVENKILESQKQLEKAIRDKSEFIMNVSHDIRTPCSGIVGFSKNLHDSENDPIKKELLYHLYKSGEELLAYLNNTLDTISHEDVERISNSLDFDVLDLHYDLEHLFAAKVQDKSLNFMIDVSMDIPCLVYGDKDSLYRILLNVVSNAVNYTDHGHILLSASVLNRDVDKVTLRFEVEDTGIGIAEEDKDRIFEKFYKIRTQRKNQTYRSGVGLYVVNKMINAMGGAISVECNQFNGSTFICDLPFMLSKSHLGASISLAERMKNQVRTNSELSLRILLVEDNHIAQEMGKLILEEHKFDVVCASSGKEVLALLDQPFDLILMDIGLPDADGLELTKEIRHSNTINMSTAIVGLTAHLDQTYREKAMTTAGMNDLYTKPLTPEICQQLRQDYGQ